MKLAFFTPYVDQTMNINPDGVAVNDSMKVGAAAIILARVYGGFDVRPYIVSDLTGNETTVGFELWVKSALVHGGFFKTSLFYRGDSKEAAIAHMLLTVFSEAERGCFPGIKIVD